VRLLIDDSGDAIDVDVVYAYRVLYDENCMFTTAQDTTNLLSSYLFDNDEGYDDNTGSYDGTNNGAVLQGDGGVEFDGVNDYINCGNRTGFNFTNTTPFTLSAWVYCHSYSSQGVILCHRPSGCGYQLHVMASGVIRFFVYDVGWRTITSDVSITTNEWTHVSVTFDNTTFKMFVNGVQQVSTSTVIAAFSNSVDFNIGSRGGVGEFFNGVIREVLVYNTTAKTASECQDLYLDAMKQAPVLEYSETISAESSAYTTADNETYTAIDTIENGCIYATYEMNREADESREDGVLVEVVYTSASTTNQVAIVIDESADEVIGLINNAIVCQVTARGISAGSLVSAVLMYGAEGARLTVIDSDGVETDTDSTDHSQSNLDRLCIGNEKDDSASDKHADTMIYNAGVIELRNNIDIDGTDGEELAREFAKNNYEETYRKRENTF